MEKECAGCGKKFTPPYVRLIYCSDACRRKARRERQRERYKRWIEKRGITKQCILCGTKFKTAAKNAKYCSRSCARKAIARHQAEKRKLEEIREQIPPAILKATERMRRTYGDRVINGWLIGNLTKKLREAVMERDGYRCYICGKETNLHVHHIVPRIQGGPHIPENLITLCASCHGSIEKADVDRSVRMCVKRAIENAERELAERWKVKG